ncbi:uncharacterized protein LOC123919931 isoform X2 [Trifolium pratense]|uniref:uncharacterized protein LOC123919931 isoform X2 n=1 Tax=Trifolium pratense TaxID=57577 RepID=UPI001E6954C7|nr:uncharacterized protein LOC123919931 isoform X2 [Trifolium pratense]
MFDSIEHRLCLRHLYANFKKKFGGGTHIRDLMMGAAKATYYQGWLQKMNELKALDKKAWDWLMAVPTKNWSTCKSKTQDPEAMNRKRKQPRGKDNTNSESKQDNANTEIVEPIATTEVVIDASQSQVEAVIDASQSFFDEIPDEVMATVPEINHDDIPKKAKAVKDNAVKDKPVKDKAKTVKKKTTMVEPEKRRQSERQKANWVKKPTIGPGK